MTNGQHEHHGAGEPDQPQAPGRVATVAVDPVCGMQVTLGAAAGGSADHGGTTYWFCSPDCREKFVRDPSRFLSRPPAPSVSAPRSAPPTVPVSRALAPSAAPPGAVAPPVHAPHAMEPIADDLVYTCPMHPEVRQQGPGACPKCGMALEPATPSRRRDDGIHLPDAPRDRADRARDLPDLRHGARAADRDRRRRRRTPSSAT